MAAPYDPASKVINPAYPNVTLATKAAGTDQRVYSSGTALVASSIDRTKANDVVGNAQLHPFYYYRKALVELVKEQFFMPLADVRAMPKHYGKKIKQFHYLPLLDDRNINDQGIDAAGALLGANNPNGNLYGSSKDIGTIVARLPALSETGGRVNRVGYSRKTIEGEIHKLGFFDEYTQDSLDFDTDEELEMHTTRESLRGANQITEAALQIDLLNGAGIVMWPKGLAADSAMAEGTAATDDPVLSYDMLKKVEIQMNNMRAPKDTKIISGSRMIDTRTLGATRVLYVGSELQIIIERMQDYHGNAAFIPIQQYANAGNVMNGEIGSVGNWRIVVVPEMLHNEGGGGDATGSKRGYSAGTPAGGTGTKYNVYYGLAVGSGSFTSIGFQTNGKAVKFKIYHKKPGEGMVTRDDPYGETGIHSIKWFYGTLILRPEWICRLASLGN